MPSAKLIPAETVLAGVARCRISWRRDTKGPLAAEFAALRVLPPGNDQMLLAKSAGRR